MGAVIAGGASRRFGSDKACANVGGRPMIDAVIAGLAPQVDELVVCGRQWHDLPMLADVPASGLGPLGGLCAALFHAQAHAFDGVLCVPVDVLPIPADLRAGIGDPAIPWVLTRQSAIGYWPAGLAERLRAHLKADRRSLESWIEAAEAHRRPETVILHNMNDPDAARRYLDGGPPAEG